jgi:hypothetical protein
MGRLKKLDNQKKIKFSISVDQTLYNNMVIDKIKKSSLINKLLAEYYGKKNL